MLMVVGFSQRPFVAGNGGLGLGIALLPSMAAIIAVSSPHTKAPALSIVLTCRLYPEPRMLSPSSPYISASSIALARCSAINGFSALTKM